MGEEGQNNAYSLFLRISKNLALNLPLEKNRIIAAKWIRKIDRLTDVDDSEKSKYLKLICISMQSKILVGPFAQEPPQDNFNATSISYLKPVDIKSMVVDWLKYGIVHPQPYHVEMSGDLKEYLVYQEIAGFGSHFYYACSSDPITCWAKNKFTILPKGALESTILIPPLAVISKTKEEYVNDYNLYLENLKKGSCTQNKNTCQSKKRQRPSSKHRSSKHCPKIKEKPPEVGANCDGENTAEDSACDYVDYQLIGQGMSAKTSPPITSETSTNQTDRDLPTRISFLIGDDPEPFYYQLAKKGNEKCEKSVGSKNDKIKALALELLKMGAVQCERDALLKAQDLILQFGCI